MRCSNSSEPGSLALQNTSLNYNHRLYGGIKTTGLFVDSNNDKGDDNNGELSLHLMTVMENIEDTYN